MNRVELNLERVGLWGFSCREGRDPCLPFKSLAEHFAWRHAVKDEFSRVGGKIIWLDLAMAGRDVGSEGRTDHSLNVECQRQLFRIDARTAKVSMGLLTLSNGIAWQRLSLLQLTICL
jgi:hypothetical protein